MSGVIYGGDEVGAVVLDIGSTEVHAGYAGEDVPSCIFPSTVGYVPGSEENAMDTDQTAKAPGRYIIGSTKTNLPIPHMEMRHPLQDGIVEDWDLYERVIEHAFEQLYAKPNEHPVMFNDEAWSTPAQRQRITEIMFEKYQVPAYYLAKKPVMSAFANGKPTALVFDINHSGCSVYPVSEGYLLTNRAGARSKLGGRVVLDFYNEYLRDRNIELVPKYAIAKRGNKEDPKTKKWTHKLKKLHDMSSSFHQYQCYKELQDLSDTVTQVPDQQFDESAIQHIPTVPYELATGCVVNVDSVRFRAPEVLFNPRSYAAKPGRTILDLTDPEYNVGAAELIMACVRNCDIDSQSNMLSNVVVTGSTSLMQGFVERLTNDLQNISPPNIKMRLLAGSPIERKYSSWIGGSILGCLGSFQQMWVSKQEYEENGKAIVEKKCS